MQPFHLAIPVHDLSAAQQFYGQLLGCSAGRQTAEWADYNFFGHQLTLHLRPEELRDVKTARVNGRQVPTRHFGVVLTWNDWQALAARLKGRITFIIEPYLRFRGETGEQATMFFADPSGNALEFKSFQDISQLFAPYTGKL